VSSRVVPARPPDAGKMCQREHWRDYHWQVCTSDTSFSGVDVRALDWRAVAQQKVAHGLVTADELKRQSTLFARAGDAVEVVQWGVVDKDAFVIAPGVKVSELMPGRAASWSSLPMWIVCVLGLAMASVSSRPGFIRGSGTGPRSSPSPGPRPPRRSVLSRTQRTAPDHTTVEAGAHLFLFSGAGCDPARRPE
jgi:hypothetical protein